MSVTATRAGAEVGLDQLSHRSGRASVLRNWSCSAESYRFPACDLWPIGSLRTVCDDTERGNVVTYGWACTCGLWFDWARETFFQLITRVVQRMYQEEVSC